jgi:hypothetical protein
MPGPLYDLFFPSDTIEFESDFPLAESVQRLQDVAKALSPSIRGTVAETYVSIHRADPPTRQDFRPWFFGRFLVVNGRVILRGSYSTHEGVKVFTGVWLAGCLFVFWRMVVAAMEGSASPALLLVPVAMVAVFAFIVWQGHSATRDDPAWISDVIESTLKLPH